MTDHRELGRSLNGQVWQLLASTDRTADEAAQMVDAAHASQYHWREAGGPPATRGEWLVSHVYAVLGRAEPALHHAHRCRELADSEPGVADFDHAYAAEAMARALACAGDLEPAATWHSRATAAGKAIADDEDREIFTGDLTTGPWFSCRRTQKPWPSSWGLGQAGVVAVAERRVCRGTVVGAVGPHAGTWHGGSGCSRPMDSPGTGSGVVWTPWSCRVAL